jgi:hypothetical protein
MSERAHIRAVIASPRLGAHPSWSSDLSEGVLWAGGVALAVVCGSSNVAEPRLTRLFVALPALVLALSVQPEQLFADWLLVSPLVQGARRAGRTRATCSTSSSSSCRRSSWPRAW